MFLLIQKQGRGGQAEADFTFHNVSINTNSAAEAMAALGYALHSIMFLLIPSDSPIRKPWLHLYIP